VSESDVQTIREVYDAFGRGDIPAVMGVMTDDVVFHVPDNLPHGPGATGPEEVGEFFERLGSTWTEFELDIMDFVDGGDKVFVRGRARGQLNGNPTTYGFVHVFHVQEGKVPHFDEYIAQPEGGF
jgi:hypothetical protein